MTSFYLKMTCVEYRQWKWGIVVVMVVFLGVAITATDCQAQAVPSRNQTQMMTRPIVPPPESPLQKQVGEIRAEQQVLRAQQRQYEQQVRDFYRGAEAFLGRPIVDSSGRKVYPWPQKNAVKSVSELEVKVKQLEAELNDLKRRVEKLEKKRTGP